MTSNRKQGETAVPHPRVPGRPCSAAAALQLVGERWALLAIREIFYGNRRYEQIVRNTGAPRDRLAARLRALEEVGVVERHAYSERPLRFEYHLTEAGRDLAPVMHALLAWGDRWAVDTPPVAFRHRAGPGSGHEAGYAAGRDPAHGAEHDLDLMSTCRTCGEEVGSGSLTIEVRAPGWDRAGPVDGS
ncbi:HxlR family transcriptional regulator [Kitasatospora herbaricolor]|uniref:winged helix-turn-helix transcriptional regulator n=1 Tax=Kitasatospora herbaricolor TaxID=68217 RepID=UPI0019ACCC8E|nr:helix-turn-helix domain-containing protein [Kitasatospora herbaricolor]MDQ0312670.1 DNA-binding HxlR family transcriptional regulator [Kitasatospora herbaricolor]GGV38421.1 HxlR family transcriptional regulator [Kitasatospora herbaricolor]